MPKDANERWSFLGKPRRTSPGWLNLQGALIRKILAPIKIKSTLPRPKPPPPKRRNFMDMGFSCRKNAFFQVPIKLVQPFPAPELRTKIFTDTRIFLNLRGQTQGDRPTPDRRFSQIHPFSLKFRAWIQACGGRNRLNRTADIRWKPKIFTESCRKPQIGVHPLKLSGTNMLRCIERERLRLSCVCVLKTAVNKTLRFRGTEEKRGRCDLGSCVPKCSVTF